MISLRNVGLSVTRLVRRLVLLPWNAAIISFSWVDPGRRTSIADSTSALKRSIWSRLRKFLRITPPSLATIARISSIEVSRGTDRRDWGCVDTAMTNLPIEDRFVQTTVSFDQVRGTPLNSSEPTPSGDDMTEPLWHSLLDDEARQVARQ